MVDSVTDWLEQLGLGQYAEAFVENAIEWTHLPDLNHETLQAVGVKAVGHRMTILTAVASLSEEQSVASPRDSMAAESHENLATWERHPGERKPVTMLFADITGSTALTEKLDAEEAHDLLYGATQRMCAAVENNRGTVCRFMGDGVMAMFGAPVASERHAVDACGAALEMQQAVCDYASDVEAGHGSGLQIRVGLHSGEVVVLTVGEGDKIEYDASGPTVPIAARMEQSAEPGEVFITAATNSLAASRIETQALEPVSVKGISEPVPVFALRRVRSAEEARPDSARTAFVGRRAELIQFRGMLEACIEEGHGQTVYVRGEPGIGKTRLAEEFSRIATEKGASCHRGLVLPFGVGKGQDAIRSLVRSLLGIGFGSGKDERQRAANKALTDGRLDLDQAVFLNDLLDLQQPTEQRALYDAMDNTTRNQGKQAVVSRLLTATGKRQPILAIVEDVHWADAITLAHLSTLTKTVAECPALLVMTSRIEGDQLDRSWRASTEGSPFITIDLGPLRKQDSIALISEFIDSADPLAESCLERASGNPLFLEQLLRNAREGTGESLPDSIQSLVVARMDRLEPEDKRALRAASVIGQRFELAALCHLLEVDAYHGQVLVEHNLVRPEGTGYLFAHALIQEGVYGSLLKSQRQALHARSAEWFADHDTALHAEHLGHAGDPRAADVYLAAAHEQTGQYRFEKGLSLTERGLSLAQEQSVQHRLRCLKGELLHDLGDVEASIAVYREALQQANGDLQRCDAWMGMAAGMRVKTDYQAALEFLDKAEPVAVGHGLTRHLSRLHHLRGNLCFPLGRIEACREGHRLALEYAREAGSLEDEARALGGLGDAEYARGRMRSAHQSLELCVELCRRNGLGRIEVANRSQMANCLAFLGSADSHLEFSVEATEAAAKVGHHRAEMNAIAGICNAFLDLGDPQRASVHAERGLDLAKELRARAWEAVWLTYSGMALHLRGDRGRAQALIQQALENEAALPFTGGWVWGALSMVTDDPQVRAHALREGERSLRKGMIGSNYLTFYRFAIEASLHCAAWEELVRYAQALEDFTCPEPLPRSDFFIARGRALAAFGRGDRDDAITQELQRLRDEAERVGLKVAIPALEEAISLT